VGGNTLTDNNTVTQNPGKINNAAQFTADNSEYLSHIDNAALSTGDIDYSIAAWVYLDSKPVADMHLVDKSSIGGNFEYRLAYIKAADRFRFYVSGDGTASTSITANSLGVPSLSTWYFIMAWHNSVANTINIQINNGIVDSASYASGSFDGTSQFRIGRGLTSNYLDGRIDEVGFWKRVLTAAEITALYNSGNGFTYPFIFSGSLAKTLGALTATGTAKAIVAGAAAKTLGELTAAGAGAVRVGGQASPTLADLTATGSGAVAIQGEAALQLADLTSAASGALAVRGSASPTLNPLTTAASGGIRVSGIAAIQLAPVQLIGRIGLITPGRRRIVVPAAPRINVVRE
jgi:hypothetical protein